MIGIPVGSGDLYEESQAGRPMKNYPELSVDLRKLRYFVEVVL
jgi:hypothetical protein